VSKKTELLSILNVFGASELNLQESISDWKHSDERKNQANLKMNRKLLRNKNIEERKQEFNNSSGDNDE
jgi:hypothetical protein